MEIQAIVRTVIKTLIILIFWFVLLFSLFLAPRIDFDTIMFSLVKALVVCGVFWVLLAMLVDTFVKSMVASAKEKKVERFQGGISYHLSEPSPEEKAWRAEHLQELKELETKKKVTK